MEIKQKLTLEDFKTMKKLEEKYYDDEFITPYEEVYEWYNTYDYSIRAVEEDGEVIGFLNLFPIKDEIFNLLKQGKFNDKYLEKDHIVDIYNKDKNEINLFLSCILIDDKYRKTNALQLLLEEYVKYYSELEKSVVIKYVITDNVTESGARFSERLGFTKIIDSNHDSKVYATTFNDLKMNIRKNKI